MSDMQGMPPVERLSDVEWKRIEEGLMARLDCVVDQAPSQRGPSERGSGWRTAVTWSAVGAMAAAAIALLVTRGGDPVAPGPASRMATADSSSLMTLRDATLTVAPHSALLVSEDRQGGVLVVLERGSVHCAVAPRAGRPPFVVSAGEVRIEVLGTHFGVSREGDLARVIVEEGVVVVIHRGIREEVGPGQTWPSETVAGPPAAPPVEPAEIERAEIEPAEVESAEVESAEPAINPKTRSRTAASSSARDRYGRAAAMEGHDPNGALAIYREIADAGGAWAPLALFAMGRLQLDVGQLEAGTRTLRGYLARFPDGANTADARALLERR